MLNTSFAPWPSFTQEEADAVSAVLLSNRVNYWTGEECRTFERGFAAWSESEYAIAVTNGTVALDLALQGLGIGSANGRSEEHTSELQSLMRTSYAGFCLKKKKQPKKEH